MPRVAGSPLRTMLQPKIGEARELQVRKRKERPDTFPEGTSVSPRTEGTFVTVTLQLLAFNTGQPHAYTVSLPLYGKNDGLIS